MAKAGRASPAPNRWPVIGCGRRFVSRIREDQTRHSQHSKGGLKGKTLSTSSPAELSTHARRRSQGGSGNGACLPDAACTPAQVTELPATPPRMKCDAAVVRPPEVCK